MGSVSACFGNCAGFYRWLRQGSAALAIFITLFANIQAAIAARNAFIGIHKAELAGPTDIKGISIIDSANYVKSMRSTLNRDHLVRGNGGLSDFLQSNLLIRPNRHPRKFSGPCHFAKFILWDISRAKTYRHLGSKVVGGSLTRIADLDFKFWTFANFGIDNPCLNGEYIGSQLTAGAKIHDSDSSNKSQELQKTDENRDSSNFVAQTPTNEPSIEPLLWSLAAGGTGLVLCLFGGLNFGDGRRIFGSTLFTFGLLLGIGGLLIWWPRW
jgi:hypothetical protein